jgi:hypothetical protein
MKPAFALNLDHHRIALLHRAGAEWDLVGDVRLDTPDLDRALGALRKAGSRRAPGAMRCKLILPPSQILYTTLAAPGPDARSRREQIRAALHGMTPYAVDDLMFDWSGTGAFVQVAVVARETLDEAEAFAAGHRFAPVSFVAVPEPAQFGGEPFFGTTRLAGKIVPEADRVMRDNDPVRLPPELTDADEGEEVCDAVAEDPGTATTPPPQDRADASAEQGAPVVAAAGRFTLVVAAEAAGGEAGARPDTGPDAGPDTATQGGGVAFSSRRDAAEAGRRPGTDLASLPPTPPATPAHAAQPPDTAPDSAPLGKARPVWPGVLLAAGIVVLVALLGWWVFFRAAPGEGQSAAISVAPEAAPPAAPEAAPGAVAANLPDPGAAPVDSRQAPLGASRDAQSPVPGVTAALPVGPPPTGFDAGLPHGTVFAVAPAQPGGATQAIPAPFAGAAIPGGHDPVLAETDTGTLNLALGPDPAPQTQTPAPPVLPLDTAPGAALPLPDQARVVATGGIGTRLAGLAPMPPEAPRAADIDPLPGASAPVDAQIMAAQTGGAKAAPALAGLRPRARPRVIPESQIAAAPETAEAQISEAQISALAVGAAPVPRTRPARLVADLAAEAAAAQAAASAAASAAAIAASPRPDDRPRDLATVLPTPEAEDEPEPTSAAPRIPTRASVAAQATQSNAVKLREINLIGVFGNSSDRRALIRLPNGKMVRVRVGDRLDGGQVATIDKSRLIYVKSGRSLVLELPKG